LQLALKIHEVERSYAFGKAYFIAELNGNVARHVHLRLVILVNLRGSAKVIKKNVRQVVREKYPFNNGFLNKRKSLLTIVRNIVYIRGEM